MANAIVIIILIIIVALAIRRIIKNKGTCSCCPQKGVCQGNCDKKKDTKEKCQD